MKNLDHIINWKLLAGSHDFPGPDGGTCINEAAIVAAGFEYRKVAHASDCPPCFSRPLSAYLIALNDEMPDDVRQRLMPFAIRLSGSADTDFVEMRRAEYIVLATIRRILPSELRRIGLVANADMCAGVLTIEGSRSAVLAAAHATSAAYADAYAAARAAAVAAGDVYAAAHVASAAYTAVYAAVNTAVYAAKHADIAAYAADTAAYAAAHVAADVAAWETAIDIAARAFEIGNQAPPSDIAAVRERLDRAKATAG